MKNQNKKERINKTFIKKIVIILLSIAIVVGAAFGIFKWMDYAKKNYELETITEFDYYTLVKEGKTGVIDKQGNVIIEPEYNAIKIPNPQKPVFICIYNYNENSGTYQTKVLNEKKEEIFTDYEEVNVISLKEIVSEVPYEKSVLKYKKDGKYGLINFEGKVITKPIYEEIDNMPYKEGELKVKKDEKYGVINIKGATLVECKYDSIDSDNYYSKENQYKLGGYIVGIKTEEGYRYGYINEQGKQILKNEYNKVYRMNEIEDDQNIYLVAEENGQAGLYKNGRMILNHQYQGIDYDDLNGVLILEKNRKYGVSTLEGKQILSIEFDSATVEGNYIYVEKDNQSFVYDINGNKQDTPKYKNILATGNENYHITIDNNDRYGVVNKNGDVIITNKYYYVEYLFDQYFIAGGENGKSGVINDKNEVIVDIDFDVIQKLDNCDMIQTIKSEENILELYDKTMAKVVEMQNGKIQINAQYIKVYSDTETKYFDLEGREKENTEIFPNNTLYAKQENGKWGFVDKNGNVKVNYQYDKVTEINEYGFAGIRLGNEWGVIDANGNIIVEPVYQFEDQVSEPEFIGKYYKITSVDGEAYYSEDVN